MRSRQVYKIKAGNIERLRISEESLPEPSDGQVSIAIRSIGLNFADVFAILGLYSATPKGAFIPGLEFSGEVVSIGPAVTAFQKGDRVMGVTRFGAYASHINIDECYILPIPEGWDFEEGASFLVQVLTAFYGLINLGNLKSKQTVLIHSAAGGVGLWANRICKHFGAYTIGTVGSESKIKKLKEEGYDKAILRITKSFRADLLKSLDGRRLDIIMECIGGRILKIGFEILGPMGRHIIYGSAHYGSTSSRPNYFKLIPKYVTRPRLDPQNMIAENKSVMAFNLIYLFDHVDLMHELLQQISEIDLGNPILGHRYDFADLPEAIRFFQTGKSVGKIVVNV